MRKARTALLEPGTQTPSPAPDLIPAENLTRNSHSDWYNKRGHITPPSFTLTPFSTQLAAERQGASCGGGQMLLTKAK